ncbi:hypothetical protein [Hanstruepera ponticola]|uniref:hypothetical protein n=1 Tax=Hanstruepera ponticola TaxID=2042995 RepID=UPI0013C463D1|nr:hypothetical protein [Hanstruepera ponticola]
MENKTGKYFKYAIGEIVLVMIGILLALQVNNWNEQRKLVQKEVQVLIALKEDIETNINNLNEGIRVVNQLKNNNLQVIKFFEQKTPYEESMIQYFSNFLGIWDPDFSYASYENLKSQNLDLISNRDLRQTIVNLFDVEMDMLDIAEMERIHILFENMIVPIQKKYFYRDYTSKMPWPYVPMNYSNMIEDMEFYAVCTEIAYRQTRSIERFKEFNIMSASVIEQIDSEIKVLK